MVERACPNSAIEGGAGLLDDRQAQVQLKTNFYTSENN
jgi:hypothetical protein